MPLYKIIFTFLFLLFEIIDPIKPIVLTLIGITSSSFGPCQTYCANKNVDLTVTTNTRIYSAYFTIYAGVSSSNYSYSKSYPVFGVLANASKTQTVVLPTREYLTSNGMYIKLVLNYDTTLNETYMQQTYTYTIYPIDAHSDINPEDYITEPCVNSRISYSFNNQVLNTKQESFQFPDYIDYFNIDTYHRLNLSSVVFDYNCDYSFSYSAAYLQIYDDDNVFPYISKNDDGYFLIPLKVIQNGNKCSFAFKNQFYVHPKTAQMSFNPEEGFVLTRYFYLPKNERDQLLDKKMNVYLYGAGYGSSNITWNLTYLASQNLLGDCSDSDYCIIGEQKNG